MTFSEVLKSFFPVQETDFFKYYNLGQGQFYIYSPLPNVISCVEMLYFTDIKAEYLAFILNIEPNYQAEKEEFKLVSTTRENLLKYLINITSIENEKYISLDNEGYILKNEKGDFINKISTNVHYDNYNCFLKIGQAEETYVCFSTAKLNTLENQFFTENSVIYIPEVNPFLFEVVNSPSINIFIDIPNSLNVLKLIILKHQSLHGVNLVLSENKNEIGLGFSDEFALEDLLNLTSDINTRIRTTSYKDFPTIIFKNFKGKYWFFTRKINTSLFHLNLELVKFLKSNITLIE